MRLRLAWMPALAAALLLTAAPAHAITRTQATAAGLRALAPKRLGANVVVFGLPRALGARSSVIEAAGRRREPALKPRGRRAWLFWADQDYNAFFEHPSRLVLIDDRSGRVIARRSLTWYP